MSSRIAELSEKYDTPAKRASALVAALDASLKSLAEAAEIFHLMEASGDNISLISRSTQKKMRQIYRGEVLIEVYDLHPDLQKPTVKLPLPIQRQILADEPMPVVIEGGDVLNVQPSCMTAKQIKQVFDTGYVRDTAEQRAWVEDQRRAASLKMLGAPEAVVTVDKRRIGIVISAPTFLSRSDLIRHLGSLESA